MRLLYDIVFFVFSIFYLPIFIAKGKFGASWRQRFGRLPREAVESLQKQRVLWVHAVSVGEIALAVGFLDRLHESLPDTHFVITTTTQTGYDVASKIKKDEDSLFYFPVDFRFSVRAFIRSVSPEAVVLFETEIWPNLIWELSRKNIPALILNGRISDKAFGQYRKARGFLKNVLKHLRLIAVQDERMRERFVALGADPGRVHVTGNLKFDWKPTQGASPEVHRLQRFCRGSSDFLCVAGSTHEGEEEMFFDIYEALRKNCPGFRLLIAPRHLDRLEAIEQAASRHELATRRVSTDDFDHESNDHPEDILLLDQMGILPLLYATADVVFVGGSLVPAGGHNLVEAAYFEKPICFGPFMNNFAEMAEEFKKNEASCPVRDARDLEQKIAELFLNPSRRQSLGRAAKRLVLRHQGAADKNKDLLLSVMNEAMEKKNGVLV